MKKMKKIKQYNLFLEGRMINVPFKMIAQILRTTDDLNLIKELVNKEIPGIFKKVSDYVDTMYDTFDLIDFDHLKSATFEIFDEYPECYNKVFFGIFQCQMDELNRPSYEGKWKRVWSANYDGSKSKIINNILLEIFSSYTVISEKNISDDELSKIFDCFKPGILISINSSGTNRKEFSVNELEKKIDDSLPNILNDVEYDEVVFDYYREKRQKNRSINTDIYHLKILLKF
jgi:hypothetical protein